MSYHNRYRSVLARGGTRTIAQTCISKHGCCCCSRATIAHGAAATAVSWGLAVCQTCCSCCSSSSARTQACTDEQRMGCLALGMHVIAQLLNLAVCYTGSDACVSALSSCTATLCLKHSMQCFLRANAASQITCITVLASAQLMLLQHTYLYHCSCSAVHVAGYLPAVEQSADSNMPNIHIRNN